ncbi:hypothetical protein D9M69_674090 [compost metagenome]
MPNLHIAHAHVIPQPNKLYELPLGLHPSTFRIVAGIGLMSSEVTTSLSEPVWAEFDANVLAAFDCVSKSAHS